MKWFSGSIPEAIAAAKTRNAIFVVYIHDSSEASKATDETLTQEEIGAVLGSESFVAIRLENGTEEAKQFSQIYPLVLVPSLFFISGETGIPLEVLGGPLTPTTLSQKLENLVTKKNGATNASTAPSAAAEPVPSTSEAEMKTEEPQGPGVGVGARAKVPKSAKENIGEAAAAANDEQDDTENANSTGSSLEDRVERAKVLLAEKQAKESREKAEEAKQKEIDRRKTGQEIAKQRQQQEEDSMRQAAMERKRDKEEDRLARERVRAQIATDRAEREARAALLRGEQPPPSSDAATFTTTASQAAPTPSNSNTSRLKFRLPNGSFSLAQFAASTTLGEVQQYIQDNIALPSSSFTLASTVHQGAFRVEDEAMSLRDLGLVPSAILVILPASGGSSVGRVLSRGGGGGGFWDILWLLLTPITFLLGMLRRLTGGGRGGGNRPAPSTSNGPTEPKPKREEGSATTRNRPQTAYGSRGEARLRREGNIFRLSNPDDDDDDENNTWNGNSTQQM